MLETLYYCSDLYPDKFADYICVIRKVTCFSKTLDLNIQLLRIWHLLILPSNHIDQLKNPTNQSRLLVVY